MIKTALLHITILLSCIHGLGQEGSSVHIGILADCQYCNCEQIGKRYYRLSLAKLDECVSTLNASELDGVFHLGDMIDHGYGSYDSVLPRFAKFSSPLHLVLGNHDYMIRKLFKPGLTQRLGMKEDHYRVDFGDWTIIVLNGDDLSYMFAPDRKHKRERNEMINDLYSGLELNGMIWNGGIGQEQMKWLETQLTLAQGEGRKVIVACHFPLYSKKDHNLYNRHAVFALIDRYLCVKAYFSGHYHAGSYSVKNGIHLVNFKGMVDTQENAFSVVTLTNDSILIRGYGREADRRLGIRR